MSTTAVRKASNKLIKKDIAGKMNTKEIFIVILFMLIIGGAIFWFKINDKGLIENGSSVVGTVISVGANVSISYKFNNNLHKIVLGKPFRTIEEGEKFTTKIDVDDPENYLVEFWNPIINRSDYLQARLVDVSEDWFSNDIKFKYIVENREYVRYQRFSSDLTNSAKKQLKAIYKLNKPHIAYLVKN